MLQAKEQQGKDKEDEATMGQAVMGNSKLAGAWGLHRL